MTALLPERDGEFKYRIRRQGASVDLVVGESELRETRDAMTTLPAPPTCGRMAMFLLIENSAPAAQRFGAFY